jgi:hypothetical protein
LRQCFDVADDVVVVDYGVEWGLWDEESEIAKRKDS